MKKVVFCGGGTAGHVMPNIALIEKLKNKAEIHYIGGSGIEKDILKKYDYVKYHEIKTTKLIRKFTLRNLLIPFKLASSISDTKKLLKSISPDVIFSKGGYASVPVVFAHGKTPVYAHESDYTMGLANKLIYPKCKKMFFSFEATAKKYKKGIYSGTPIRKDIMCGNGNTIKTKLGIKNNKKCVLVVGGSSGARDINNFVFENISTLTKKYNIIHICGKNKTKKMAQKNYFQIEFAENMGDLLSMSDIVISRAGSNAIFELLVLRKPMILVPLPATESRGDQILNAKYFENKNWAKVIMQNELTVKTLTKAIDSVKAPCKTDTLNAVDIILKEMDL